MEAARADTTERLIRIEEVKRLTGLSAATLYRKMAAGDFPQSVRLGNVARAWPLSEVQNWIAALISLRGLQDFGGATGKAGE